MLVSRCPPSLLSEPKTFNQQNKCKGSCKPSNAEQHVPDFCRHCSPECFCLLQISSVVYPGLPDHKYYPRVQKLFGGLAGGVVTFELTGGAPAAEMMFQVAILNTSVSCLSLSSPALPPCPAPLPWPLPCPILHCPTLPSLAVYMKLHMPPV